jgi:hypothetical protein
VTAAGVGAGFPGRGIHANGSPAESGVRSPRAQVCRFRGCCGKPAVGVCTLCSEAACAAHSSREHHFNVVPFVKGASA